MSATRFDARRWFYCLVSAMALLTVTPVVPAGSNGVDTDGDGVIDTIDIDDDNDGVVDLAETASNFQQAAFGPPSGNTINGTLGSTTFTYTSSTPVLTTTSMYNHSTFPAQYNVPNSNPTVKNEVISSNTLNFAEPVLNPIVYFSSIGNPSTFVPIDFSADIDVLWSTAVTQNSARRITGTKASPSSRSVARTRRSASTTWPTRSTPTSPSVLIRAKHGTPTATV